MPRLVVTYQVLQKRPASKASDVFAYAIVLNEIATGIVPYSDCTKDNPACHTVLEMGYGRQELAAAVAGNFPSNSPNIYKCRMIYSCVC